MPRPAAVGVVLDALRGVRWPARRPVRSGAAGAHQSSLRGLAAEFTEYRPYRQGDDPRRLDWKLLARSNRAYLRLSDDHVTLGTMLVLDASASMAFPPATAAKWEQACLVTIGLAAVAQAAGDPVGLCVAGPAPTQLPARTRRGIVGEIVARLDRIEPGGGPAVAAVLPRIREARLVVVSDFLDESGSLHGAVAEHVARGGELHAVHVVALEECDPAGTVLATDPEDPAVRRPLTDQSREEYRTRFAAWRVALAQRLRASGAAVTEVLTDEPPAQAVRRIVAPGP